MHIAEVFLRRPVGTLLLALGLFMAGAVAFDLLPVAPLPRVDMPTINVSARLPGADPATMAATVAAPLEKRLGEIAGVTEITSNSSEGSASVSVQFDLSRDINGAARDVQAAINASTSDMPADLTQVPTYRKVNSADAPILILAVQSDTVTPGRLYDASDTVMAQRMSQIEGVAQVSVSGAERPAVRVRVNPAALASLGLGLEDVRSLLTNANVNRPKGAIDGPGQGGPVGANDQLVTASGYAPLIIKTANGNIVRLSAIAQVTDSVENERMGGWFNRDKAVLIIVQKQADANVIDTVDRIKAVLPQLQAWMPPGTRVTVVNDRTTTIRASVHDVELTLGITIVLVVLVVLIALGRLTPTLAASITVPLSLAGTFGAMWLLDYSLNNISLMALTISVGFVVDDAIVMIENISRFVEKGDTPFAAAIKGAKQITFTVISITVSLVAVFIPLLFMGGIIGRLFREFAVTLTVAIVISALVSITVTPTVYALLMSRRSARPHTDGGGFGERLLLRAQRRYVAGLSWVLRHQGFMLGVMVSTIVMTVCLYIVVPKGLFPQQDTGTLIGTLEARTDVSFSALADLQQRVSAIILDDPAVEDVAAFIGSGNGAGLGGNGANLGRFFVTLKPEGQRGVTSDEVINRLRPKLAKVTGASVFMQVIQDIFLGGRSAKSQFQFTLWSESLEDLRAWTPKLEQALKDQPGLMDVNSDQDNATLQADVQIDREAAARLNVSVTAVDQVLQDAFAQRQVSTIFTERNQYHVVLEVTRPYLLDASALARVYVKSSTGQAVPLSAIAHFGGSLAPLSVNHQGQFPSSTLSFNLALGTALGDVIPLIERTTAEIGLPANIHPQFSGNAKAFADNSSSQPLLIGAALLAIYIVLGVLYENTLHPLTIISTLPSAGIGALLALLLTGLDLSVISVIGVILLMGIVKKNGIMMVDFAIEAERHRGFSPERAILEACKRRFRPITMTTLAAILGALPLALGSGNGAEMRRPLGVAIVGGLLVSQFLTLYTTPVVYLAMGRLSRRRRRKQTLLEEAPGHV